MKRQPINRRLAMTLSVGFTLMVILAGSQKASAGDATFFLTTTLADAPKANRAEIVLIYYPSVFRPNREESEYVLVRVQADGKAKVVLYGEYYWSDTVSIYEGRLPKPYVRQLVKRASEVLSRDSSRRHYAGGPQDEEVFYLSTLPLSQTFHQRGLDYLGLLETPSNVSDLIYELRTLWKRLEKVRPAYAYLRVESAGNVSPQHVRQDLRFKPLQAFTPELRPIVLAAVRKPLNFEALSRRQIAKILSVTPNPTSFYVVIGGIAYRLNFYLPRTKSPSTSKETPKPCSLNLFSKGNAFRVRRLSS